MTENTILIVVNGRQYVEYTRDQYGVWTDEDGEKIDKDLIGAMDTLFTDVSVFNPEMVNK